MRKPRHTGKPAWGWRRLLVWTALAFIAWQLYGLRIAEDTRVNDTLAFGYLSLAGVLVLTYTGLATAQDIAAIWATRNAAPYAEQPPYGQSYGPDYGQGYQPPPYGNAPPYAAPPATTTTTTTTQVPAP